MLGNIDDELEKRLTFEPFIWLESFKSVVGSRPFLYSVRIIVLGLILYAIARWSTSSDRNVGALAPELLSSVLLILLTGKREA
jgi:hypothetical protein